MVPGGFGSERNDQRSKGIKIKNMNVYLKVEAEERVVERETVIRWLSGAGKRKGEIRESAGVQGS
jgi:hypothetical protein